MSARLSRHEQHAGPLFERSGRVHGHHAHANVAASPMDSGRSKLGLRDTHCRAAEVVVDIRERRNDGLRQGQRGQRASVR